MNNSGTHLTTSLFLLKIANYSCNGIVHNSYIYSETKMKLQYSIYKVIRVKYKEVRGIHKFDRDFQEMCQFQTVIIPDVTIKKFYLTKKTVYHYIDLEGKTY